MYKYKMSIELDLSRALSEVGELTDRLNESMESFGYSEKMTIRSKIGNLVFGSDSELNKEKLDLLWEATKEGYKEKPPDLNIIIGRPILVKE